VERQAQQQQESHRQRGQSSHRNDRGKDVD
jgi:hypothetical protein